MIEIQAYASRTGTKRNLAALRAADWGLFVSAAGVHRNEGFRFKIDNGAWTAYTKGLPWPAAPFEALIEKMGRDPLCEGIVAPDIVCGGVESLRLSLGWLDRLLAVGPRVYLPVQPGITPGMISSVLGPRVGVFVGGENDWKEQTAATWSRAAHEAGGLCHVGRVNSRRRLMICKAAQVDSFDGSGPSRFEVVLHEMERFRHEGAQMGLDMWVIAWCFWIEDGEIWWNRAAVYIGDGIEALVLAAREYGAGDVYEIQLEDGAWVRRGASWAYEPLQEDP